MSTFCLLFNNQRIIFVGIPDININSQCSIAVRIPKLSLQIIPAACFK